MDKESKIVKRALKILEDGPKRLLTLTELIAEQIPRLSHVDVQLALIPYEVEGTIKYSTDTGFYSLAAIMK